MDDINEEVANDGGAAGLADEICRRLTNTDPASWRSVTQRHSGPATARGSLAQPASLMDHPQVPPPPQAENVETSRPPPRILCEVRGNGGRNRGSVSRKRRDCICCSVRRPECLYHELFYHVFHVMHYCRSDTTAQRTTAMPGRPIMACSRSGDRRRSSKRSAWGSCFASTSAWTHRTSLRYRPARGWSAGWTPCPHSRPRRWST